MSSQVLREQGSAVEAFVGLIRGHASVTRAMNARLLAEHGLTINDFEALLRLSRAEAGRMRRVDLAAELLLTASGVTRLLDGLDRAGLVDCAACSSDRRVTYAVLTEAGREKLAEAAESHVGDIRGFFDARFSEEELARLAQLLGRLADAGTPDCA